MAWWVLCYVAKAGKEATVAVTVGPFHNKQLANTLRASWIAVHADHRALPPWYASDYENASE